MIMCLQADEISNSRHTAITRAIEKVGPAVASINVEQNLSSVSFDPFFGFMFPREVYPMKTSGSGVIISPDGFLMTNHHVIENADKVTVTFSDCTVPRVKFRRNRLRVFYYNIVW